MATKTVKVKPILEKANELLKNPILTQEFKEGVVAMLEGVLHKSGNYQGFMFLRNVGTGPEVEAPRPTEPDYYDRVYFG